MREPSGTRTFQTFLMLGAGQFLFLGAACAASAGSAGTGTLGTSRDDSVATPAESVRRIDFDDAGNAGLIPGCGGAAADWETVRSIEDPRDGSVRSRGAGNESCLLAGGGAWKDVALSARIDLTEGLAGFVLRHADPNHYVGVYLDTRAGIVRAAEWDGYDARSLGVSMFDPPDAGAPEVLVALSGDRLRVFMDGRILLEGTGVTPRAGGAGLLAEALALARFDDTTVMPLDGDASLLVLPAAQQAARVGQPFDLKLHCHRLDAIARSGDDVEITSSGDVDVRKPECRFSLAEGSLPEGLSLEPAGEIRGVPLSSGASEVILRASMEGGPVIPHPLRIDVRGTGWPRFPLDLSSRKEPLLAVLYTPDDIGQTIRFSTLGRPDRFLFLLHREHPMLHVTLSSTPANRYMGGTSVLESPEGAEVWRKLALDPEYGWIDLAGHGYSHSPPGDENPDHHEFSVTQSGCNVDHRRMADPAYCRKQLSLAREAYRDLGIPDDRVLVMRFPGRVDNPQALAAAREAGFIAILGRRHNGEEGREWWIPTAGGGEILEIQDSHLSLVLPGLKRVESALEEETLSPDRVQESGLFFDAVRDGEAWVERVANAGGILNLTNHFWETFEETVGVPARYLALGELLGRIEKKHDGRIWYPSARDLALWLDARRNARAAWTRQDDGILVEVEPPPEWKNLNVTGLDQASLRIALPPGWSDAMEVRMSAGGSGWQRLEAASWWRDGSDLLVSFPLRGPVRLLVEPRGGSSGV